MKRFADNQVQNTGIFILTGMVLVIIVRLIRPNSNQFPEWMRFTLGILPNFAAAFSLPFLIFNLLSSFTRRKGILTYRFYLSLSFTFIGLASWEVVQYRAWNYEMDPYDIAATALGCLFAFVAYRYFSGYIQGEKDLS
jgi:hypothetical protein